MSPFTAALIGGIESGDADRDNDGWVSLVEAVRYLQSGLRHLGERQRPRRPKWLGSCVYRCGHCGGSLRATLYGGPRPRITLGGTYTVRGVPAPDHQADETDQVRARLGLAWA